MLPKIAFIDDDANILEVLKWMFKDEPFQLFLFQDPFEALVEIKKQEFALVVIDNAMPEIKATELLDKVKRISPKTECRIMTANTYLPLTNKNQIIKKPWDVEELKAIVRDAAQVYHNRKGS